MCSNLSQNVFKTLVLFNFIYKFILFKRTSDAFKRTRKNIEMCIGMWERANNIRFHNNLYSLVISDLLLILFKVSHMQSYKNILHTNLKFKNIHSET